MYYAIVQLFCVMRAKVSHAVHTEDTGLHLETLQSQRPRMGFGLLEQ